MRGNVAGIVLALTAQGLMGQTAPRVSAQFTPHVSATSRRESFQIGRTIMSSTRIRKTIP